MSTTGIKFSEKGLQLLWSWILDKITHDLSPQCRFIIRIEWMQIETLASIQNILDDLYHGTATDYINQFWHSDGKDIGLVGLKLFQAIKIATESLEAVIKEDLNWLDANDAIEVD